MCSHPAHSPRRGIFALVIGLLATASTAHAQTNYSWFAATTGSWNVPGNWSITSGPGTTFPVAGDTATFNNTGVNGTESIFLGSNTSRAQELAASVIFNNTGATTLAGGLTGTVFNILTLTGGGGITVNPGAGAVTIGTTGGVQINAEGNQTIINNSSNTLTFTNNIAGINAGTQTLTFGGSGKITAVAAISNTTTESTAGAIIALATNGTGTLVLSAANTYTGGTAIQNGTVDANITNALPSGSSVTMGSGSTSGVLVMGTGSTAANQTLSSLTSSGTGTANAILGGASANSTLTVNNAAANAFVGNIGGAGTNQNNLALTKGGAGALTLTGTNSYTGATTVNAGTLTLNGANTTTNTITVSAGAALTGIAQASGSPFGTSAITANTATVTLTGIAANTSSAAGAVTFSGASNFIIDNSAGTSGGFTTTFAAGNAARSGTGTLIVTPVTGALGTGELVTFTNGNSLLFNNILLTYVAVQASGSNTTGDFASYGANGLVTATAAGAYTSSNLATSGSNDVVNQSAPPTITGPVAAYALNTNQAINLNGNTLSLGNGVTGTTAGLILNGGSITNGTVAFGPVEGTIYASGTTSIGAGVTFAALTTFGPGTLGLTGNMSIINANAFPTGTGTITNQMTTNALTLGSSGSTITLGGSDGQGKTLVLASSAGANTTTIVNGVMQDPPGATAGSTGGTVSITSSGVVQLNALSTYTGGTTGGISINAGGGTNLGTWPAGFVPGTNLAAPGSVTGTSTPLGGVVEIGVSSNGPPATFTAGPLGVAPIYMNNGTNPILVPIGADRTIANTINMNSGFIASNIAGNPYNLIFTGQMNWNGSHQLLSNIPAPEALFLNGNINLSTTTSGATDWTLGSQSGTGVIIVNGTVSFPAGVTPTGTSITLGQGGTYTFNGPLTNINTIAVSSNNVVSINAPWTSTAGTLTDSGTGTLNLNAQNTYPGGTTLTGSGTILGIEVSSNALPGGSFTSGPFGTGTVAVSNEHLRPIGGSQSLSNAITMTAGLAMDNVPGDTTSNLTIAGAIGTGATAHFVSNGFSAGQPGATMILGAASSPSTFTLPTTTGNAPSFGALQGPIVINDVIQNGGSTANGINLNPQTTGGVSDSYPITINAINTYTGTTTIGGGTGGSMPTNIGPILLGSNQPFGVGGALVVNSTLSTATLIPVDADRTVANPVTMTTGFAVATATAAQDATGPHNLTLTGPITLAAAQTLTNNMASSVSLTLGSSSSPSTINMGGTLTIGSSGTGTTIINDSISGAGGLTLNGAIIALNASNSFSGTTNINGGTVLIGNSNAFSSGSVTINNPSAPPVLSPTGADQTIANAITMASGFVVATATAAQDATGPHNLTLSGPIVLSTPQTLTNNLASSVSLTLGSAGSPSTISGDGTLIVAGSGTTIVNDAISGAGGVTMSGTGTLVLANTSNSYSGNTSALNGTTQVPSDAALGAGNVTGAALGTLAFTGTTTTARQFAMNGGTISVAAGQTVTFNGSLVTSAILDGAGAFATSAATGAQFFNLTTTPSVAVVSNNSNDQFVHFVNGGAFSLAAGVNTGGNFNTTNFNGVTNQGLGSVTIGAGSQLNVANFQSYGMMNLVPATVSGQFTELANLGTAPLGFNGGSQTFVGTAAAPNANVVGVDLHGQNMVISGGLFVNNGLVFTSTGSSTIFVDYGATYKGAGTTNVPIVTQNGGKVLFGNCPGVATFGSLVIGSGGIGTLEWEINDAGPSATYPNAPGVAGPKTVPTVSGWSLGFVASQTLRGGTATYGNFSWTATPGAKFDLDLETLAGPSTQVGSNPDGLMADFDPTQSYSWPIIAYQGIYSGPTSDAQLTADTVFDRSLFANALPAGSEFGLHLDQFPNGGGELDLVFTPSPVPEPGTLALTGLAGLAAGWVAHRRRAKSATV